MMLLLRSVLVIAAKDLAQRSRDRSAYLMGIVGPLVLVFILNSTLGAVGDPSAFQLGLANEDGRGEAAAGFATMLAAIEGDGVIELTVAEDRAALDRLVEDGDIAAGYHIPAGFSEAVEAGQAPELTVVGDPGSTISVDVAEAIAATFASELDYVSLAIGSTLAAGGSADPTRIAEIANAALAQPPAVQVTQVESEGRGADITSYFSVSLSLFFLFFTVQFGVLSLMEEREVGTLQRIMVAPVSPSTVLIGKMASSLVIGLVSMGVLVVATTLIVGAQWGDPLAVVVLIVVGTLTAIALATVVGAVARTSEQASAFASIAALVFGLLGGIFFPVTLAPGILSSISYLSPHRWLLEGFRDVSYGAGLTDLGTPLAVLAGFIVIVGAIGVRSARRGLVAS